MGANVGGGGDFESEPNVIPLTDILLVLLIIFMVITPLLKKGVDVRLPEAKKIKDQSGKQIITVSVKKDGTIYYKENPLEDIKALEETMVDYTQEQGKTRVFFKADKDAEYGRIVDVIGVLQDSGIKVLSIITDKETITTK